MLATDSVGLALAQDPFSMDGDQDLVTFATQQYDRHSSQRTDALQRAYQYRIAAWILSPTGIGSLIAEWQAVQAEREAAAADRAARWYLDANDSYKQLIGARSTQLIQDGYWCRCRFDESDPSWTPVASATDCATMSVSRRRPKPPPSIITFRSTCSGESPATRAAVLTATDGACVGTHSFKGLSSILEALPLGHTGTLGRKVDYVCRKSFCSQFE